MRGCGIDHTACLQIELAAGLDRSAVAAERAAAGQDRTGKLGRLFRPHDRCAAVTSFASGDVDLGTSINRHSGRRRDRRQRAPARGIGLIERIGLIRLASLERTADAHEAAARRLPPRTPTLLARIEPGTLTACLNAFLAVAALRTTVPPLALILPLLETSARPCPSLRFCSWFDGTATDMKPSPDKSIVAISPLPSPTFPSFALMTPLFETRDRKSVV